MTESFCKQEIGCDPRVVGPRILVKAAETVDKVGSIYVPDRLKDSTQKQNAIGRVLKMGPTAFEGNFESYKCEEGDWVSYSPYERSDHEINGHLCYCINDDRVFFIIPPEELHFHIKLKG